MAISYLIFSMSPVRQATFPDFEFFGLYPFRPFPHHLNSDMETPWTTPLYAQFSDGKNGDE